MTQSRQSTSDAKQQSKGAAASGGGSRDDAAKRQQSGGGASEMKAKGQEMGSQAQEQVGKAAAQAQEQVGKAAGEAQEQVGRLAGMAQEQVTSQLASQKTRAADKLGVLATALHDASKQVRNNDEAQMADYIDAAAGQIDQVASALREQDVMQLLRSAEHVARRQPELFLAATFAIGFAATRFFRSSSPSSGTDWSRYDYGSSYRGMSSGYGSGGYGQGYPGTGMAMGSQSTAGESGFAAGYGSQMDSGYGSRSGYGADMGPGSQAQSGAGAASATRSGYGDSSGTGSRSEYAGAGSSSGSSDWQSGSSFGTRSEER